MATAARWLQRARPAHDTAAVLDDAPPAGADDQPTIAFDDPIVDGPTAAVATATSAAPLPIGSLLVVGGQQRKPRGMQELGDAWYGYGTGLVLAVDDEHVEAVCSYVSPPGTCLPTDPILFKSATYRDGLLYACTQTEVLVLSVPDFEVLHHISLPIFNDVHHVVPTGRGTMLVANSGLEMVVEIDVDGRVHGVHNVLGEDPWAHVDPSIDHRCGVDLKPHRAHPNHVFFVGDEPFATRFECRDAISLVDPERRIDIGTERVHDGVVVGDRIHFTTVDGYVVIADAADLQVVERVKLTSPLGDDAVLGWCRGLTITDDHAWVGFSRIRATRFRQTLSWVRAGTTRFCPTRIARYRLPDWTLDVEIDLEPYGLNAVFTVVER